MRNVFDWSKASDLLREAAEKLACSVDVLEVYSWPQVWGNTGCGFGGVSGQALTEAQTFMIRGPGSAVAIFHAGRFAYVVQKPNGAFWEDMKAYHLAGVTQFKPTLYEEQS